MKLSSDESVTHRRLNTEMTWDQCDSLLLTCTTYSCDVRSLTQRRRGCHSCTWDSFLMITRSSCNWLFSSRMWWFQKSATNTRPSLSTDKYQGTLTSVNEVNRRPWTSTSLTYTHSHWHRLTDKQQFRHLANWIKLVNKLYSYYKAKYYTITLHLLYTVSLQITNLLLLAYYYWPTIIIRLYYFTSSIPALASKLYKSRINLWHQLPL